MNAWEAFYGPNVGYALELYDRYQADPDSVDEATRAIFDRLGPLPDEEGAVATLARPTTRSGGPATNGKAESTALRNGAVAPTLPRSTPVRPPDTGKSPTITDRDAVLKVVAAARLARGIREYGHLEARIDPLGGYRPGDAMLVPETHRITEEDLRALPASIVWPSAGSDYGSCWDAIGQLRDIYCGSLGYEFDQVQDFEERAWLHTAVESGSFRTPLTRDQQRALLQRLTEVEGFERFIHTAYQNQKRFSIEGTDMLVPMLDHLVARGLDSGIEEILIGMAHRGRLNVLTHVLQKPPGLIFSAFHTAAKKEPGPPVGEYSDDPWTGDVKYHLGWQRTVEQNGHVATVVLADNPSHLEIVSPVIEGFARAAQDDRSHGGAPEQNLQRAMAITIHGDAAFPGEGIVAETLNLSCLAGYKTGGTVRIIVNNQVGFTTGADDARSTMYASDLAKGFEIPIVHVNADDPEACLYATRLAQAYRDRFHRDFLIDLVGYRRWGHNEGDEPSFTQPRLYAQITTHPTVRATYAEKLIRDGVVTADEVDAMQAEVQNRLRDARDETESQARADLPAPVAEHRPISTIATGVPEEKLRALNEAMLERPAEFSPNPRLERILTRRREALDREGGIDWAMAESLAFASILVDGTPIRLTGQDTERGTFSQRHLVLHDPESGQKFVPLQRLPQARGSFAIYNSPLTEAAVMGFEYGYSVHAPDALVLWEAQFGDFANMGQVIVDQYMSAARAKWRQEPTLTLLLPHGYEGQGPEHSSGRLERFLQLAAEDNLRIVNCTTAAQYFHILRVQAATLVTDRRPMILMTPKSLLRHPRAGSSLGDLTEGSFQPVIDTGDLEARECVERLVLCSGKVAIDLASAQSSHRADWVAVARMEQLYPSPKDALAEIVGNYPHLNEVVWLQEEPSNMGAWHFIQPHLHDILPGAIGLRYIGRPERASTAEGSSEAHDWEQAHIIGRAFEGEGPPPASAVVKLETRGVQNVG
ncbi:MAG: 2-oxoglutarate dehydrogenase E1 component [Chloroflexota bacterium]